MNTQELTQEQIRVIGLEALARELGATGLIRFLQIYEQGSGDYTRERADILPKRYARTATISANQQADVSRWEREIDWLIYQLYEPTGDKTRDS
jgi:hypothetical protein